MDYIESFDTAGQSIKIAGEVKNFDVLPYLGEHKKNLKLMSRAVRFAVGAAALAVEDAGLDTGALDPARFGVCMGAGITPVDVGELVDPIMRSDWPGRGASTWAGSPQARAESIFPLWLLQHLPNMAAAHISILHQAMGPNNTIVTACAAGTQAVGEAFRLIARGDADVMLAGGCDSRLDPQLMVAYSAMKAVSTSLRPPAEVSRPFDAERDGFVLGEGAAVLVLESYRAGPPPRRDDLRRDHRLWLIVRRVRHHPARARRQGGCALDVGGAARGSHRPIQDRLHQRPRNQHAAERPDGDGRGQARLRPPGQLDPDQLAEVDDRPLDRGVRRGRSGGDGAFARARSGAPDDQSGDARPRTATSTTSPTLPAKCRWQPPSPTASASAVRTPHW